MAHDRWSSIANLNFGTSSPSVCTYKNKLIFKFGGIEANQKVTEQIEKYDPILNTWVSYQVKSSADGSLQSVPDIRMLWLSCSCQINETGILVFGGCDEDNVGSTQTFLLEVAEGDIMNPTICNIRKRNTVPLPYASGFWSSQAIVYHNRLYALQNELMDGDHTRAYESSRNLLVFENSTWSMFRV